MNHMLCTIHCFYAHESFYHVVAAHFKWHSLLHQRYLPGIALVSSIVIMRMCSLPSGAFAHAQLDHVAPSGHLAAQIFLLILSARWLKAKAEHRLYTHALMHIYYPQHTHTHTPPPQPHRNGSTELPKKRSYCNHLYCLETEIKCEWTSIISIVICAYAHNEDKATM